MFSYNNNGSQYNVENELSAPGSTLKQLIELED